MQDKNQRKRPDSGCFISLKIKQNKYFSKLFNKKYNFYANEHPNKKRH